MPCHSVPVRTPAPRGIGNGRRCRAGSGPTGRSSCSSAFGDGFQSQLLLVAQTPDTASRAAWTHLVAELPDISGVVSVSAPANVGGPALSMVSVTPTTTSQAKATSDLVYHLRSDVIKSAE